ncbi:histone H1-like [Ambystoma mexicanum]|uniref:histone H1-like n=1 Tax=Ambystoma mexicanum TaxID=8296 RepID=UPI0037E7B676
MIIFPSQKCFFDHLQGGSLRIEDIWRDIPQEKEILLPFTIRWCITDCGTLLPQSIRFNGKIEKALSAQGYDVDKNNSRVKLAVKSLVSKGALAQLKGTGASGSFKLNKKQSQGKEKAAKKAAVKSKTPAAKKPAGAAKKPKKAPAGVKKSPKKVKKPAGAKSPKKPKAAPAKKAAKSPAKAKAVKAKAAKKSPAKVVKPKAVKPKAAKPKKAAPKKK